jgi:Rrf2 family nitric oxide-sensitive transcriptional repressor
MHSILKISEGAAIALHAADYLYCRQGLSSAANIAEDLGVSYNHLSKVLQQLTRAGLIAPVRGPKGGFELSAAGKKARVKDFIEAIDGPPATHACLMKAKVCLGRGCMLGRFLEETNARFDAVLNEKISVISKRK